MFYAKGGGLRSKKIIGVIIMEIKDLYQKVIDAKKQDLKDDPDFDEKIREYDKYLKEETADMTDEGTIKFLKSEIRGSDPKSNRKIWAWVISAIAVILIAVAGYKFFYPGTEKTLSTVDSSEPTVATQVAAKKASINLEDENFLQWDTANPQKKVMANNSDDYSLPEEADEATETALEYLRHNAETLIGAATARGVTNIPEYEDLVVEINGKKYLSEKGRELYSFLEAQIVADPTTTTKIDTTAAGFTAHNSGIVDNQFTVNSSATDLSGRKVLVIQYSDGVVMYASLYCGNFFFSAPPKGVPTGEVPQPPVDTTTPPKESQTPPPTIPTTPEGLKPKDINQAPQRNPEVISKDENNVRPGANGPENATVNTSPGTSYQGSQDDVKAAQEKAAAEAAAQEKARQEAAAKAEAEHKKAEAEAAAELAAQKAAAEAAAQAAKTAEEKAAAEAAKKRAEEEAKAKENQSKTETSNPGW